MDHSGVPAQPEAHADELGLTGRGTQIDVITGALTDARQGKRRVVVLDADAGLGKTTLLRRIAELVPDAPLVYVACDLLEQTMDYGLVELLLGRLSATPASSVAVGRLLLDWLGRLQGDTGPVVLLIDDVQWMDTASVEGIRFALRRLGADRVLAVLARRPPRGADPWSGLLADTWLTTRVRLAPLMGDDVVEMAQRLRGWELGNVVAARLVQHTGGIPLLLQAFLQGARHPGALSAHAELPLPATARASVLATLGGARPCRRTPPARASSSARLRHRAPPRLRPQDGAAAPHTPPRGIRPPSGVRCLELTPLVGHTYDYDDPVAGRGEVAPV